jgi:DNA-binding transcriptional LysR family regulator
MDRLQTLQMFIAVADRGSFSGASRALRTSPPAVTRGIAELEARLGVVLFHRSTRAVSLTDEGAGFLEKARRILAELADAERQLVGGRSEPRGELHVTAPVLFGRLHVLPVIAELLDQHPTLIAQLMLIDRNVRIVEEGIDVAVRIGQLTDSALKAVRIGWVRPMLVASPTYLARFGLPDSIDALAGHRLIATMGPRSASEWRLGKGKRSPPVPTPKLRINSVAAAIAAAEAGVGIANLLSYQAGTAIREGRLIEVFRPHKAEALPVNLLFEASRSANPANRAFIDAMINRHRLSGWD